MDNKTNFNNLPLVASFGSTTERASGTTRIAISRDAEGWNVSSKDNSLANASGYSVWESGIWSQDDAVICANELLLRLQRREDYRKAS